jgi:benzylsuccinate CoA-transferase BbsF subunit
MPEEPSRIGPHETLRAVNPTIVTVDLSGFGATGPEFDQVSWGPILEGSSGMAHATGYADSGPYKQGLAFPDAVGGLHGTMAILAALWERDLTGRAVHVDVSQLETYLQFGGELVLTTSLTGAAPPRHGNRADDLAPQGVYPCAGDDRWLAVSVTDDDCWHRFVATTGIAGLDDPAYATVTGRLAAHDELDRLIGAWTAGRDALQEAGVPAGMAMSNEDLVGDPHLADRNFFVTVDQADAGPLTFPGFPYHAAGWTPTVRATPPLGGHNDEILTWLGYGPDAIAALRESGTISDEPPA